MNSMNFCSMNIYLNDLDSITIFITMNAQCCAYQTPGGGYFVERWVRGCAAQIGCFFGLSGFPMAPFLF